MSARRGVAVLALAALALVQLSGCGGGTRLPSGAGGGGGKLGLGGHAGSAGGSGGSGGSGGIAGTGGAGGFVPTDCNSPNMPASGMCVASPGVKGVCQLNLDGPRSCVACGGTSEACCAGQTCDSGGCCVKGLCWADGASCYTPPRFGTCHAGKCGDCGTAGAPCCPPSSYVDGSVTCTESGTMCNFTDRICHPCGGPGQVCCDGHACDNGGCCGQLLADGSESCVASGTACGGGNGTCQNGSCGSCGGLNQPCCRVGSYGILCTGPYIACIGIESSPAACLPCGGLGQLCCGAETSDCMPGLKCQGQCVAAP